MLLCYVITMEHITYENIVHHLEDNDGLFAKQHGYRKNHSCETRLILTVEDLAISKAFYKVPHQCLINKLHFYGIQGSTLACIKSWLSLACSFSSSGSTEVPEAFFTLSVLFFPLRSYDKCCTSVPVRFFSCLYYVRNERYALVGKQVTYH